MRMLADESIDLVVTSPPYDGIRVYNGFSFDLHKTGEQVYRVLKDGCIAAVVMQDQTRDFGKTLTTFRTAIDWCDNIGFKLFECLIYRKHGSEGAWWKQRFRVDHEYILLFLKGHKPAYFNKEPLKVPSKHGGKVMTGSGSRHTSGKTGETVRDRVTGESVKIPDERSGLLMVFRTYDKLSYGLVLQASRQLAVMDKVRNP